MEDEEPETNKGNVTLVNAKFDKDNQLIESEEETGIWAWKVPHKEDDGFDYVQLKGEVRFYDVTSATPRTRLSCMTSASMRNPVRIAFVGATGAGKTTITNLINRFSCQWQEIRYDGINIDKIKKGDLRRSLGIVLQDVTRCTRHHAEDLRYGKLTATDEGILCGGAAGWCGQLYPSAAGRL